MYYDIEIFRNGIVKSLPGPNIFRLSHYSRLYELCIYVFIIKGNGKTIILDTGCGDVADINKRNMKDNERHDIFEIPEEENIESIIQKANIDTQDIDFVFLTHLHHDHISNVDLFPNAKVVLSKKGLVEYMKKNRPYFYDELIFPERPISYISSLPPEKIILVDGEQEIVEGINAFWVGGHTPCCIAFEVETKRGKAVFTSDIAFLESNISQNHPVGVCYNLWECYEGYSKIRNRADIVLTSHDPDILNVHFKDGRI
jgi:glyoxylase-like metal-dependent hydrolase (beta-lactamase superfamily II)